ncbi:Zn(2)-C6 fungal-type domain-containing protein [Trichoderma simmonsii]|uniref:Zn(2)-C6 fungal-type domain-containing protein n=1 Tax=Trichoderma simmonsii TaxID=1491479 RepID=A0A8G0PJV5_9HYPO|nr:Zn(2)-C6 fungal-type domain-containing protein [Trichoderma simmonsii]
MPHPSAMADQVATKDDTIVRKRKTHRKSRLGCGNCKIRGVKCDESKPTCRRCHASGFTCNYSRTAPTLQLSHSSVLRFDLSPISQVPDVTLLPTDSIFWEISLQPALRIPIVLPLQGRLGEYTLRPQDYAALHRFQTRTAASLGTLSQRKWYPKIISNLAKEHPFLFHFFLALSLLHDAHLSQSPLPQSHHASLAFHWYHSTAILSHFLSLPSPETTLSSSHRDALWICASTLGAASFASIRTQDPSAAWPLADPNPAVDLDWLKMGHGKRAVWNITDPNRPDSVFHNLLNQTPMQNPIDSFVIVPDSLPPLFYKLFKLSATSSPETNPYHGACAIISALSINPINDDTVILFLSFITQIDPSYRSLIEEKDPRALLLLLYWHSMVVREKRWWLRRRCIVEGKAILMYLERYSSDDADIMELLQVPKRRLANWNFINTGMVEKQ